MSPRIALFLLLIIASLPLAARDVRLSSANGDGGTCPDQSPSAVIEEPASARAGAKRDAAPRDRSSLSRGGDAQAVRPPRWHSFLPGMFR